MCCKPGRPVAALVLSALTVAGCGTPISTTAQSATAQSATAQSATAQSATSEPASVRNFDLWSAPTRSEVPATVEARETAVTLGAAVYAAECAACHGAEGEGQPEWQVTRPDGSLPAPPHDASGHTWHHPDDELIRIIRLGGTIYMENSHMPGFGETLTEREIEAVLAYMKTWWGPEERAFQEEQTWMRKSFTATAESQ